MQMSSPTVIFALTMVKEHSGFTDFSPQQTQRPFWSTYISSFGVRFWWMSVSRSMKNFVESRWLMPSTKLSCS